MALAAGRRSGAVRAFESRWRGGRSCLGATPTWPRPIFSGTADAKRKTLAALEIAPTYERAQDLLLNAWTDNGGR